mmetsp:Transcript_65558/g.188616  ORF Transcript_65558/g.188616 Transcript_65558/m.188616 type:complete len:423 (-) Transcript_65558:157-1425(-)
MQFPPVLLQRVALPEGVTCIAVLVSDAPVSSRAAGCAVVGSAKGIQVLTWGTSASPASRTSFGPAGAGGGPGASAGGFAAVCRCIGFSICRCWRRRGHHSCLSLAAGGIEAIIPRSCPWFSCECNGQRRRCLVHGLERWDCTAAQCVGQFRLRGLLLCWVCRLQFGHQGHARPRRQRRRPRLGARAAKGWAAQGARAEFGHRGAGGVVGRRSARSWRARPGPGWRPPRRLAGPAPSPGRRGGGRGGAGAGAGRHVVISRRLCCCVGARGQGGLHLRWAIGPWTWLWVGCQRLGCCSCQGVWSADCSCARLWRGRRLGRLRGAGPAEPQPEARCALRGCRPAGRGRRCRDRLCSWRRLQRQQRQRRRRHCCASGGRGEGFAHDLRADLDAASGGSGHRRLPSTTHCRRRLCASGRRRAREAGA